ncbi:hypothetical protein OG948_25380 [Embleya sp. NBC_00888]|uniref:hypothetical protein n=1 Tax=Embleya sp. NBC_00888 TaxID=2975960 RepID=UPI00386F58A7|nr:hypothetical protein OG948_25380 [Embleya sp. NBC_00888]
MKRGALRRNLTGHAFFFPFLVVFVIGVAAPLAYAFRLSLYEDRMIGGTVFVGFDNYSRR